MRWGDGYVSNSPEKVFLSEESYFLAPLLRLSLAAARPQLVRLYTMAARIEQMALAFKLKDVKSTIPDEDEEEDATIHQSKASSKTSRTVSVASRNGKRKSGYDDLADGFTNQQQQDASASHGAPYETLTSVLSAITEGLVNAADHNSQGAVARDRQRKANYDKLTRATKDMEPFLPLHSMTRNVDVIAVNKGLLPYPRPPAAAPATKYLPRYAVELFASMASFARSD